MQRCAPPPKGSQVYRSGAPSRKRSGRSASGSGNRAGSWCSPWPSTRIAVPAGRVLADRERLGEDPRGGARQRRADPQDLLDQRVEVAVVAVAGGLRRAVANGAVVGEQHGTPGDRGRRRLVAGGDEGHQLVAEVVVAEPTAVLVAGAHEQRQDVLAVSEPGVGPRGRDLLVEHRHELVAVAPPALDGRVPARADLELREVRRHRRGRQRRRERARGRQAPRRPHARERRRRAHRRRPPKG